MVNGSSAGSQGGSSGRSSPAGGALRMPFPLGWNMNTFFDMPTENFCLVRLHHMKFDGCATSRKC